VIGTLFGTDVLQALSECLHGRADSFGGTLPKAGGQIPIFHSKLTLVMEGMENDDVSLFPVKREDFNNPQPDEDPNGWQTIALSTCQFSCLISSHAGIQRLGLVESAHNIPSWLPHCCSGLGYYQLSHLDMIYSQLDGCTAFSGLGLCQAKHFEHT